MGNEKIRVLFTENLAVESAHREIYRVLAERNNLEVHLLVPRSWKEAHGLVMCEPEASPSLHVHQSHILFGYRQHRVMYRELGRIMRTVRPHMVVLDQEPENYAAIQGVIARNKSSPDAKLALTSSRNIDHVGIGFPYRFELTHRWCDRYVRRHPVDACFVRTKAAIPFMQRYARDIVHIPFSVDANGLMKRPSTKQSNGKSGLITIGYLGRLIEPKGVRLLLNAFPYLPANTRLMFVGRGELGDTLKAEAIRMGVGERVIILPPVPHDEVPGVLAQMDLIVVPSLETKYWKEQCPRVPMEAMACGVPVIGSQSGGILEVLGETGRFFRTGDLEDLVEKLLQVIGDPSARKSMAALGRARVLGEYDVPLIAARMAEVILQCC
jgi:glycosyltransferase involved in cell wall biosynthesis